MRIGVDIDGVLNYRTRIILERGTKYCIEVGRGRLLNPDAKHLSEIFGWDVATRGDFWYKNAKYQMMLMPAQMYAAEVIRRLRDEGHEIWIVTARSEGDMRVDEMPENATWEDVTRNWLAQNEIDFDGMGFDQRDKGRFCRNQGIELMIEDDPDYLATFDDSTKLFIYDQPYNRHVRMSNAERVHSWYDVYAKFKALEE